MSSEQDKDRAAYVTARRKGGAYGNRHVDSGWLHNRALGQNDHSRVRPGRLSGDRSLGGGRCSPRRVLRQATRWNRSYGGEPVVLPCGGAGGDRSRSEEDTSE